MSVLHPGVILAGLVVVVSVSGVDVGELSNDWSPRSCTILQRVEVWPKSVSIPEETTFSFHVEGVYSDGEVRDLGRSAVWTSENSDISTMDASGRARTHTPGRVEIEAGIGDLCGHAQLVVLSSDLVRLDIHPEDTLATRGSALSFLAVGTFAGNWVEDLTDRVDWSSSNGKVASVDSDGRVSTLRVGETEIRADYRGFSDGCGIRVTPGTAVSALAP